MSGNVGASSSAIFSGRMNGTSSPHCSPMRATSSSSVDNIVRSMDWQSLAASAVHAKSGFFAHSAMFLRGIRFEPPRAGTIARIILFRPAKSSANHSSVRPDTSPRQRRGIVNWLWVESRKCLCKQAQFAFRRQSTTATAVRVKRSQPHSVLGICSFIERQAIRRQSNGDNGLPFGM